MRWCATMPKGWPDGTTAPRAARGRRWTRRRGPALKELVLAGPDLARPGRTEWTRPSLAEEIAQRWDKRLHPASLSRGLRRLGLSKQTTRPRHPQTDAEAQAAFKKAGSPRP